MILKYQDHHILGRLGMVGGFCVGGRLGTIGAARVAPPGRDGTIGAMEFIAPIACWGVIPICFIPWLTWFMVFIVCFAWLIFDCIEGIGLAGGFLGAALFMGGIGADFVPLL